MRWAVIGLTRGLRFCQLVAGPKRSGGVTVRLGGEKRWVVPKNKALLMMGGYGPGIRGLGYDGYAPQWRAGGQRLTDRQRDRLRDIQAEQHEKQFELMRKMQDRQRELYRMQLADEPDYEAIKKKSREIGDLQQKMAEERIEAHKRMEKALRAE